MELDRWTAGEECDVHQLAWCSMCKPQPPVEPRTTPKFRTHRPDQVIARYDGYCYACPEPIEAGDTIMRDAEGHWIHTDC